MQQYRVNYGLLISLLVGLVVATIAGYGLWRFQISRNAGALLITARQAEESGDIHTAVREYMNYLSIRPDDSEIRIKSAELWADITDDVEVAPEDFQRAFLVMEETVRKFPEEKELQRKLVDLYGRLGLTQQALDHLSVMISKYPDDAELQVLQMEYLMRARKFDGMDGAMAKCRRLIGYDEKSDTFDEKKAIAPHNASVYGNYAAMLRSQQDNTELADRVMEQLIKVNPDSADAYLQRGNYLISAGEPERGQRDIQKAYQLAPKDANVLLSMAQRAVVNERPERAREYLEAGRKEYPQDPRFYQMLAGLKVADKKYDEALAIVDEGLKEVGRQESLNLLYFKSELQFQEQDIKGLGETAEAMRKAGFRPEFIDWVKARILLVESKWYEAAQALKQLRPEFTNTMGITDDVNNHLGLCYEKLGQLDPALQCYNNVLQQNPTNEPAKFGRQRILAMMGRPEVPAGQEDLDELIAEVLERPKEEQNWAEIDKALEELADKQKLEGAPRDLFWARIMMLRGDLPAARRFLVAGGQKDEQYLPIRRAGVIWLLRDDPDQGPAKAMRLLDQLVEKFGDQPALRQDRADVYLAMYQKDPNEERLRQQLTSLLEPPADWSDQQKQELWNGIAARFLAAKMPEDATACLERVAALRPNELPTRMALFSLALEQNDDVGMSAAQEKILEVVGSKNDSTYLYTEARRLLSLYRRGQLDKESLNQIRRLTERALNQRPDWFELHLVKAEVELLAGDEDAALVHFNKAQQLGRPGAAAILQHVRLLVNRGQFKPAQELIEQLPKQMREGDLGQLYAEVLFALGERDKAAEIGKKYVEAAPDNAERHLRYGQLLARYALANDVSEERRKSLLQDAGDSLQKSVELGPESAEAWLALITYQVLRGDVEQARQSLQRAQLALTEDQLFGVLAKGYEIVGGRSWFDAETVYLTLLSANPDNPRLAQQVATFYLSPAYPRPDKAAKAAPLINRILRAGAEGKLPATDPGLMWARRAAAQLFAATRDYQNLLKAEKLLASNSRQGQLTAEDRLIMAQILAPRSEPVSRFKAINLFENVARLQPLELQDALTLGNLYFLVGDWPKCRSHMRTTVARYPESADARAEFIRMILQNGDPRDYSVAADQLQKFKQIDPTDIRTVQYTVQLAGKTGKQKEAREYLLRMVPPVSDPQQLQDEQLPVMEFVAAMLINVDDLDSAEKIYRMVVARAPQKANALADFLGRHRDVEECMTLLEENFQPDKAEPTLRVAIGVARARRDEIGDKYDARISSWLDRALLENPDSIPLLMLQAEFDDVQKEYDQAAAIYQKLLARKDLTGVSRAVVLNNLAFLVALAGSEAETGIDPLQLVQEAAQILGPTADILDTRAVVYISQNQHEKAIRDLEFSVTDNPTPAKYFHKAVAHLGAGENKSAVEAWEKAAELGDIRENLNRLEYELFDQIKAKIEQLQSQNAKLTDADPLRRAG